MAARQPPCSQPQALDGTVLVKRFQRIGRATGREPAHTGNQGRQQDAIGADRRGQQRTDAVILTGPRSRVVVRPSGTESKLKCYLEVVVPVRDRSGLPNARARADERLAQLRAWCAGL